MITVRIRCSVVLAAVLLVTTAFTAQAQAPSSLSGRIPRRFALGADSVLENAKPDLGPYYVPGSSYGVWGEGRQVPGLQAITRTNRGNETNFDPKDSYADPELLSGVAVAGESQGQSAFTHRIPIVVPPGINGVQPNLALVYSPHAGNGILGVGWKLDGLSVITRINYGRGINYNGADTYSHSELGVLVRQSDGTYRSKRESFSKFVSSGTCGDGPCSWTVYDRSGWRYEYGLTHHSRLTRQPGSSGPVRTWALEKAADPFGNSYDISYTSYEEDDVFNLYRVPNGTLGVLYPDVISYTNRPPGEAQPTKRTVEFSYRGRYTLANGRSQYDVECRYEQGALACVVGRLQQITVRTGGTLVRAYRLFYGHTPSNGQGTLNDAPTYSPTTGRSRLTAVQEYGSNGGVLPAQTFDWQNGEVLYAQRSFAVSPNTTSFMAGDFNGDGKTDLAHITSYTHTCGGGEKAYGCTDTSFNVSLSSGSDFSPAQSWFSLSADEKKYTLAGIADFDGDGRADLAVKWPTDHDSCGGDCSYTIEHLGVAHSNGSGFSPPTEVFTGGREVSLHARIGDFNGDGRVDMTGLDAKTYGLSSEVRGDFNGDGRSDFAHVENNAVRIDFATDNGFQGVSWAATFPSGGMPQLRAGDFNGDDKTDLLMVGSTGAVINLSTGTSFISRSAPSFAWGSTASIADFNGDGRSDIATWDIRNSAYLHIFLSTASGFVEQVVTRAGGYSFFNPVPGDFTGQGRAGVASWLNDNVYVYLPEPDLAVTAGPNPDLLVAAHNGLGSTVSVEYQPAPLVTDAIHPGTASGSNVPSTACTILVTHITLQDNGGGHRWTDFQYHDQRYQLGTIDQARNLGFAEIDATESTDNLVLQQSRTFYRQDPPFERRARQIDRYDGNGVLSKRTRYDYANCWNMPDVCPSNRLGSGTELVVEGSSVAQDWEETGFPGFVYTTGYKYDQFINPVQISRNAIGRPTIVVDLTYAPDETAWLLNKVTGIRVSDEAAPGTPLKWATFTWNGPRVTSKSEWLDTTGSWLTSTMSDGEYGPAYDSYGNLLHLEEPRTADGVRRVTRFEYDGTYHAYLTRVTNALNQVTSASYYDDGSLHTVVDANNATTSFTYDEFGRKQTEVRADGGRTEYSYLLSGLAGPDPSNPDNPPAAALFNKTTTRMDAQRQLTKYEYFDGTGSVYWVTTVGECATGQSCPGIPQEAPVIVQHRKDSASRPWRTSRPYYPGAARNWTTTEYDARSRVKKVTTPDQLWSTYRYGFDTQLGRVTAVTDPNGKVTSTYVNARGSVTKNMAAGGTSLQQETIYGYDALERPISMTPPGQPALTFTYDSLGRRTSLTDPQIGQRPVVFTYDALNRVKTQQMVGGNNVTLDYDDSSMSNGIGRLTKVTDTSGITLFGYTTMGQLKSVTRKVEGGQRLHQAYEYNHAGQTTKVVYPDPQSSYVDYAYTMGGNLWKVMLRGATKVATWSSYTATGKPQTVAYGENVVSTTYGYDDMDHLTLVNSANSTTTLQNLTYDWYSRSNTGGVNIGEIVDHRSAAEKSAAGVNTDESQAYIYDDLYRLTQVVFPWGTKEYSGYNAIGNMTNFGGLANRTLAFDGQLLTSVTANGTTGQVTHDAFGNMTHKELGGNSWDYTWTNENFLWKVSKNGVPTVEMTYDAWGQRAKKVYTGGGSTVTTLYFGKTYEKRTYSTGATARHTIYIYANGQVIAQETVHGSSASAFNIPNRWRGEVAAASLYNGHNLKGAIQKVYHYLNAAALHPQSVRWVILISFLLFVTGVLAMLVTSKLSMTVWQSSYSPSLRWASLSVLMIFTLSACGGGGGISYSSAGCQVEDNTLQGPSFGRFFYLRNQVNSTTVVTRDDGTEVTRHVYMPFGEMMQDHSSGGDPVTKKFTGQERDEETDLDYFNARYYDPTIGRFISADTIIPDVMNGMAFNRYAYVLNNPVMYEDPTGHREDQGWGHDGWDGAGAASGPLGGDIPQDEAQARANVNFVAHFLIAGADMASGKTPAQAVKEAGFSWRDALDVALLGLAGLAMKGPAPSVAAEGVPALRQQYVEAVNALGGRAAAMRQAGMSTEEIARTLHAERNALKVTFREQSPPAAVRAFEQRNLQKYGNPLGPSIDQLREAGKSWEQIAESAARSGGQDLGF